MIVLIIEDETTFFGGPTEGVMERERLIGLATAMGLKEKRSIGGGDSELIGVFVDGDLAEVINVGQCVVVERAERFPVCGIKSHGGVGGVVAEDGADDHDDARPVMFSEHLELFLGLGRDDEIGVVIRQFLHGGEGAEEVAGLHGLIMLLIIHNLQTVVLGQNRAHLLRHLEEEVFE